ncbi:MAG TPA: hypothetical protein VFS67_00530 [Polyangiaceae bacterium]|jgi:hypothetical protein|nr:hypothetical protein [Polyangiaceae bacterium]
MTAICDVSARAAIQITRAAPLFDRLVDAVLDHRTSRVSTRPAAAGHDPAQLVALRERLDWFFPQFRDLYFELLREQLGSDLSSVLGALKEEQVQRFLRALESMRPALLCGMQRLGREMSNALEASGFSAGAGSTPAA